MKENILLLGDFLKSQGITKIVLMLYGLIARIGFEFALPVYALFVFSPIVIATIWSLFLIWQVSGFYLAKCVEKAKKEIEAKENSEKE